MRRLENKVAIITGGSSGIGAAVSTMFAKEGAKVIVTDLNVQAGEDLVKEITNNGGIAKFVQLNVVREEEWIQLMKDTVAEFGQLNIVVNSAGIVIPKSVEDITYDEWKKVLNVNLDGTFLGIKYGIKTMKATQSIGSIINMSSIHGLVGAPYSAPYSASKGAVRILTKSAALHVAKDNIRVNSIHPGFIATQLVTDNLDTEELIADEPVGRLGEPAEIAYGAVYLASDEAKFTTGSELVIDGGYVSQ